MKYLVTGGLGFIGSHFIECLLKDSKTEYILNVDSGSYAANKNFRPQDSRYDLLSCDIGDKDKIKRLQICFDVVVNFASHSHVDNSISNPSEFIDNNIKSFFNFLEVCKYWHTANKFKKIVHISTDEVFGDALDMHSQFDESSNFRPSSAYSASKASQEMFLHSARKMSGLKANILRMCNNYGPRQHSEKFIPVVLDKILNGQKIPIYGSGNQKREWLYVTDAVKKIKAVCENIKDLNDYCISSDITLSNLELVNKANDLFNNGNQSNIDFIVDRVGHDRVYSTSDDKFRFAYPDLRDSFSLEQGLIKTYESLR